METSSTLNPELLGPDSSDHRMSQKFTVNLPEGIFNSNTVVVDMQSLESSRVEVHLQKDSDMPNCFDDAFMSVNRMDVDPTFSKTNSEFLNGDSLETHFNEENRHPKVDKIFTEPDLTNNQTYDETHTCVKNLIQELLEDIVNDVVARENPKETPIENSELLEEENLLEDATEENFNCELEKNFFDSIREKNIHHEPMEEDNEENVLLEEENLLENSHGRLLENPDVEKVHHEPMEEDDHRDLLEEGHLLENSSETLIKNTSLENLGEENIHQELKEENARCNEENLLEESHEERPLENPDVENIHREPMEEDNEENEHLDLLEDENQLENSSKTMIKDTPLENPDKENIHQELSEENNEENARHEVENLLEDHEERPLENPDEENLRHEAMEENNEKNARREEENLLEKSHEEDEKMRRESMEEDNVMEDHARRDLLEEYGLLENPGHVKDMEEENLVEESAHREPMEENSLDNPEPMEEDSIPEEDVQSIVQSIVESILENCVKEEEDVVGAIVNSIIDAVVAEDEEDEVKHIVEYIVNIILEESVVEEMDTENVEMEDEAKLVVGSIVHGVLEKCVEKSVLIQDIVDGMINEAVGSEDVQDAMFEDWVLVGKEELLAVDEEERMDVEDVIVDKELVDDERVSVDKEAERLAEEAMDVEEDSVLVDSEVELVGKEEKLVPVGEEDLGPVGEEDQGHLDKEERGLIEKEDQTLLDIDWVVVDKEELDEDDLLNDSGELSKLAGKPEEDTLNEDELLNGLAGDEEDLLNEGTYLEEKPVTKKLSENGQNVDSLTAHELVQEAVVNPVESSLEINENSVPNHIEERTKLLSEIEVAEGDQEETTLQTAEKDEEEALLMEVEDVSEKMAEKSGEIAPKTDLETQQEEDNLLNEVPQEKEPEKKETLLADGEVLPESLEKTESPENVEMKSPEKSAAVEIQPAVKEQPKGSEEEEKLLEDHDVLLGSLEKTESISENVEMKSLETQEKSAADLVKEQPPGSQEEEKLLAEDEVLPESLEKTEPITECPEDLEMKSPDRLPVDDAVLPGSLEKTEPISEKVETQEKSPMDMVNAAIKETYAQLMQIIEKPNLEDLNEDLLLADNEEPNVSKVEEKVAIQGATAEDNIEARKIEENMVIQSATIEETLLADIEEQNASKIEEKVTIVSAATENLLAEELQAADKMVENLLGASNVQKSEDVELEDSSLKMDLDEIFLADSKEIDSEADLIVKDLLEGASIDEEKTVEDGLLAEDCSKTVENQASIDENKTVKTLLVAEDVSKPAEDQVNVEVKKTAEETNIEEELLLGDTKETELNEDALLADVEDSGVANKEVIDEDALLADIEEPEKTEAPEDKKEEGAESRGTPVGEEPEEDLDDGASFSGFNECDLLDEDTVEDTLEETKNEESARTEAEVDTKILGETVKAGGKSTRRVNKGKKRWAITYSKSILENIITKAIEDCDKEVIIYNLIEEMISTAISNAEQPKLHILATTTLSRRKYRKIKIAEPQPVIPADRTSLKRTAREIPLSDYRNFEVAYSPPRKKRLSRKEIEEEDDIKPDLSKLEELLTRTNEGSSGRPKRGRPSRKNKPEEEEEDIKPDINLLETSVQLELNLDELDIKPILPPPEEIEKKKRKKNHWKVGVVKKPKQKQQKPGPKVVWKAKQVKLQQKEKRGVLLSTDDEETPKGRLRGSWGKKKIEEEKKVSGKRKIAEEEKPASGKRKMAEEEKPVSVAKKSTTKPAVAMATAVAKKSTSKPAAAAAAAVAPVAKKSTSKPAVIVAEPKRGRRKQLLDPIDELPLATRKRKIGRDASPAPSTSSSHSAHSDILSTPRRRTQSPREPTLSPPPKRGAYAQVPIKSSPLAPRKVIKPRNVATKSTANVIVPSVRVSRKRPWESHTPPEPITKKYKSDTGKKGVSIRPCYVLLEHMAIIDRLIPKKSTEEPNLCELCEPKRVFMSKEGLVAHLKKEHATTFVSAPVEPPPSSSSSVSRCPGCEKKYHSTNRLAAHMKTCPSLVMPSPACWTISDEVMVRIKQEDEPKYHCKSCDVRFTLRSAYEAHRKSHSFNPGDTDPLTLDTEEQAPPKFQTEMVRRGGGLKMKFRRDSPQPQPTVPPPIFKEMTMPIPMNLRVQCSYCDEYFLTKSELSRHSKLHFVCEICNKDQLNPRSLAIHRETHKIKKERSESPEIEILEEFVAPAPYDVVSKPTARKSTTAVSQKKINIIHTTARKSTTSVGRAKFK